MPGSGRWVISSVRLDFNLSGHLPARIIFSGGHGVVSLCGSSLSAPSLVTLRLGWALRVTLPTGEGRVVHLFVVYGYRDSEEDAEKLALTDRVLQAVLAEAQVACGGRPLLIAGDLNADPGIIPYPGRGHCFW